MVEVEGKPKDDSYCTGAGFNKNGEYLIVGRE
jgi:hypothetical protein